MSDKAEQHEHEYVFVGGKHLQQQLGMELREEQAQHGPGVVERGVAEEYPREAEHVNSDEHRDVAPPACGVVVSSSSKPRSRFPTHRHSSNSTAAIGTPSVRLPSETPNDNGKVQKILIVAVKGNLSLPQLLNARFRFNISVFLKTSLNLTIHSTLNFQLSTLNSRKVYVSGCKRPSFGLRKTVFRVVKAYLSEVNARAFAGRRLRSRNWNRCNPLSDNRLQGFRQNRSFSGRWAVSPPHRFSSIPGC